MSNMRSVVHMSSGKQFAVDGATGAAVVKALQSSDERVFSLNSPSVIGHVTINLANVEVVITTDAD